MAWFNDQTAPLHDPTALAKFGKLDVVAKLIVEGYMMGQHKSPFKGSSVEFVEHRQYYPGDEIRHIDWRAYGKTGKYYIKEYEEETNLRAYLIVDASGSMGYAGKTLSKYHYGRLLAACLGHLLVSQRDAVGMTLFDTRIRERFEPATSPRRFQQITEALERCEPGQETSLAKVFQTLVPTLKRRSLIIFISDCFDEIAHLGTALQQLRHGRHEVMLFQVIAPEEEDFPFTKPTQFRSLELETHRILTDPHRLRQIYLEQFREHQQRLAETAGNLGIDYCKLLTTEPYDTALGAFLDRRARRTK